MSKLTYVNIYSDGVTDDEAWPFNEQLEAMRSGEARACAHRIGSERVDGGEPFSRHDPADRSRVVSSAAHAGADTVDRAVAEARRAQRDWRALEVEQRAAIIAAAIEPLKARRWELAALLTLEVGKARADAIAEVDECVAVIEVSVEQYRHSNGFAVPLTIPDGASSAGVVYHPYGVFGVIAPFNFPCATALAMSIGALLTGNAVVLKPSAFTPACGEVIFEILTESGLPEGVLNLVHGGGETGARLSNAAIDGLAMTGSAEVGLGLAASLTQPPYARPVVAEMGGKNPVIVSDAAADIEVAAQATARAAFGMSGQKCNACSRAVVLEQVYDQFLDALVQETQTLEVGDPATTRFTGPLVSARSVERFQASVARARADGRVFIGGGSQTEVGHYADLTVVGELSAGHELTREELFVPVLTVTRVRDFQAALAEANAVRYGLAAGVFTADEDELTTFLDGIEAGILFVNNAGGATTGVWPGNQSMPGWKASGTTGKGGFGPRYLQQFVREQSRTIFG